MIWVIHQNTAHTTWGYQGKGNAQNDRENCNNLLQANNIFGTQTHKTSTDRCGRLCMVFTAVAPRRLFEQLVCHFLNDYKKNNHNKLLFKF